MSVENEKRIIRDIKKETVLVSFYFETVYINYKIYKIGT